MVGTATILTEYEKCRRQPGFQLRDFMAFYQHYDQIDQPTMLAVIGAETQYLARNGQMAQLSKLEAEFPEISPKLIRDEIADSLSQFLDTYCPLSAELGKLPAEDKNFRFLGEIGRGGEGVVYEAIELPIQRSVAIKFAFPITRSLDIEATILGQLQHPNIPTLFSFGVLYELQYFVFQMIRGVSLKSQCYHGNGLAIPNAISVILKIGSAVEACHSQGIVHCDLNLSNVISVHGNPYLVDFGQARFSTSSPNVLMGTPGRIPPEYFDPSANVSPILGDVYGLGVMLYELLTQSLPRVNFDSESSPVPPSKFNDSICPELDEICLVAIAESPGERFQSAKQFNLALKNWATRNQIDCFDG